MGKVKGRARARQRALRLMVSYLILVGFTPSGVGNCRTSS
jgi:hypothetical protein